MNSYKLQTRYAQSLFDLALQEGLTREVLDDAYLIMQVCLQNHELRTVLQNPIIKPCRKKAIVAEIFAAKTQTLTQAFLNLLIQKRRDILLYEIAQRYTEIYKEHNNIRTAYLTTVEPLQENVRNAIVERIEAELGTKVDLQTKTDTRLIGGFRLLVDGKEYDASFANQLAKLKKDFARNEYERTF